jgi:DNA modification methylase
MADLKTSLNISKDNHKAMMSKFGFIPRSVIRIGKGALTKSLFTYQGQNPGSSTSARVLMRNDSGINGSEFEKSISDDARAKVQQRLERVIKDSDFGLSIRHSDQPTGAVLCAELISFYVKYYARKGQVYLDPFMGQGTAMQVAKYHGLHYYGYDISETFFPFVDGVRQKIDDGNTDIKIFLGDSRYPVQIPDGIGDFSFYSPPYWDCEFYGDESGQLGYKKSYEDFLLGISEVAHAWLPKFKSCSWHVVNVGDIRRDGRFYSYHSDLIHVYTKAGWLLHDTWIIDGVVSGLSNIFAVDFNMKRLAPRVHEYILVFRKP